MSKQPKTNANGALPMRAEQINTLNKLVRKHGKMAAVRDSGVSYKSFIKAVSGLPVRKGTALIIERFIAEPKDAA